MDIPSQITTLWMKLVCSHNIKIWMLIVLKTLVKPKVQESILRKKLAAGMGHNSYGEIAWPNDLLYMFPVCILGVIGCATLLAAVYPTEVGEPADPFSTPLEILPEWFLLPTFSVVVYRWLGSLVWQRCQCDCCRCPSLRL